MMFGANKNLILGGAALLAIAGAGIGGYYMGYKAGSNSVRVKWDKDIIERQKIEAQYQTELKEALTKLGEDNTQVIEKVRTEYIDKINTIIQTKYENREVIKEVFKDTPYLSKGWVAAHNSLVDGTPIDPVAASDRTPSNFTEADSLRVIGDNYSVARQAIARDTGWNTFYAGIYSNYQLPSSGGVRDDGAEAGDSADTQGPR